MNNKNLIIGSVLLATAGYLYFTKVVKKKDQLITDAEIKAKQDAEKAAKELEIERAKAKEDAESLANKNSFASKVSVIQQYLGVSADGKVGPNTNNALKLKFPEYSTITQYNVDSIIAKINANVKDASDLSAQQSATVKLQEKVAFAKRLETLTNGSYYAVLLQDVSAPAYAFDSLTNSYRFLGTYKKFYKGNQFSNRLVSRGNGEILIKDGTTRYAVDPNNFIVKSK